MRALVAGATGFIGHRLVSRLLDDGHQARAMVRVTSAATRLEDQGVDLRRVDFNDPDAHGIAEACAGVDIIYNLIGQIGGWGVSRHDLRLANALIVKRLLEGCQRVGVKQFVHCSTPGVVGMSGVAGEQMPYRPVSRYEETKFQGEKAALGLHLTGSVPVTVIRPDFVYGPGDLHKLKLFRAVKDGKFVLIGGGRSLLHPTYVDDVVDGLLLAAGQEKAYGQVFNIAGPEPVTVCRLVEAIADKLDVPVPKARVPAFAARSAAALAEVGAVLTGTKPLLTRYQVSFFSRDHASDISKAKATLGYQPKVDLEEGVGRAVSWYRQEGLL